MKSRYPTFEETSKNVCEYRLKTCEIYQNIVLENSYVFSQFSVMGLSLQHFYRKMMALSVVHVVCLLALARGVFSCSNPGVVTLTDKTRYSDVIVTGSIESQVGEGKYSLTVDCVLKDSGVDIPASLNISGVGKLGKYNHTAISINEIKRYSISNSSRVNRKIKTSELKRISSICRVLF